MFFGAATRYVSQLRLPAAQRKPQLQSEAKLTEMIS
jgi:hypothetical protein